VNNLKENPSGYIIKHKNKNMKKLSVILVLLAVTLGASAQHGSRHGSRHGSYNRVSSHSRVGLGIGIGMASGYGRMYNRYPYYSTPYNNYSYRPTSQLDLRLQEVRDEYSYKKRELRRDKSLSSSQKRTMIRDLKMQRERALLETRRSYSNSYR